MPRPSNPAENGVAVTPSDSADLTQATRGLFIGGDGNVSVDFAGGQTAVVLNGCKAGSILPISVIRVRNTGTTASGLVALF